MARVMQVELKRPILRFYHVPMSSHEQQLHRGYGQFADDVRNVADMDYGLELVMLLNVRVKKTFHLLLTKLCFS